MDKIYPNFEVSKTEENESENMSVSNQQEFSTMAFDIDNESQFDEDEFDGYLIFLVHKVELRSKAFLRLKN